MDDQCVKTLKRLAERIKTGKTDYPTSGETQIECIRRLKREGFISFTRENKYQNGKTNFYRLSITEAGELELESLET